MIIIIIDIMLPAILETIQLCASFVKHYLKPLLNRMIVLHWSLNDCKSVKQLIVSWKHSTSVQMIDGFIDWLVLNK